jgi:hypothetical protein
MQTVLPSAILAAFWLAATPVSADIVAPAIVAQPVTLPPGASLSDTEAVLPAKTEIVLAINEAISSKTATIGDYFDLRVARPLVLGNRIIIPEGTPGRGQIVHASKKSWGGKAGELIVAARHIELGGRQIPLRSMRIGGAGSDQTATAMVFGAAVPLGAFIISGKDMAVPAGTLATALLRDETRVALQPATSTEPASPSGQPGDEPATTGRP